MNLKATFLLSIIRMWLFLQLKKKDSDFRSFGPFLRGYDPSFSFWYFLLMAMLS